jgi:hypothetical protein
LAAALHELLEPHDDRIAGKAAARVREIGRAGAVTRAEPANTVGAEPARMTTREREELFELDPSGGSIGNELV